MRKVAKKLCKLSLFSQLSAPIKSGVRDIKLKMIQVYFSRCIRGRILLGMNKMLFAASPISLESKRIGAPAVRRSEVHTRHGLENAACSC